MISVYLLLDMGCLFYEAMGMFYRAIVALSCSFMLLQAA